MYDPKTVAFAVRGLFTIWHVDPEKDGSDDSCDWFNHGKAEDRADPRRLAVYEALWDMETILDNAPHYPDSPEHKAFQPLKAAIRNALAPKTRHWWQHPRWHFWHWKVQIHPLQRLRRWLFTRCAYCGGRFRRGQVPVGLCWDEPRPRWFEWFRSERDCIHSECQKPLSEASEMLRDLPEMYKK